MLRRSSLRRRGGANRCMPKSGSGEPEGQLAERQLRNGRRKNQPAQRQSPKRRRPRSGSGEPEGQPAEGNFRSGACRKAEAVNPKANPPSGRTSPPRAPPNRYMPKSGSSEPEGQPAERQLRSGRQNPEAEGGSANHRAAISETEGGRTNSPSGHSESVHAEKRKQ